MLAEAGSDQLDSQLAPSPFAVAAAAVLAAVVELVGLGVAAEPVAEPAGLRGRVVERLAVAEFFALVPERPGQLAAVLVVGVVGVEAVGPHVLQDSLAASRHIVEGSCLGACRRSASVVRLAADAVVLARTVVASAAGLAFEPVEPVDCFALLQSISLLR